MKTPSSAVKITLALGLFFLSISQSVAQDVIQVGATLPLTGPLALYGTAFRNGAVLAEQEINGSGPSAPQLKVVFNDNQGDPKLAVSDARHLIEVEKVPALIGAMDFLTVPVLPITESKKVVMISATIMKFTEKTRPEYAFRTYFDAQQVGQQIGGAAKARNIHRVAVIAFEDFSFVHFRDGFQAGFGKGFAVEERFNGDQKDFGPLLLRIRAAKPDAILIYAFPGDVANILKHMSARGMDTVPLFITEGAEEIVEKGNEEILQKTKAVSYLGSRPSGRYQDFIDRYQKVFGRMPRLDALLTYEATKLLYSAVKQCGATEATCIASKVATGFDSNHNKVYEVPLITYDRGWQPCLSEGNFGATGFEFSVALKDLHDIKLNWSVPNIGHPCLSHKERSAWVLPKNSHSTPIEQKNIRTRDFFSQ